MGDEMEKSHTTVSQNCSGTECDSDRSRVCLLVSRLLLAGEVASFIGTEDAHCYTQKDRHHNHYAQDDSSNVDVIYKKKTRREIMALQGVFITCEKAIKLRTNFHHLRSTFGDPSLIPGSAVVFSSVLLPDRTEFLKINKSQWFKLTNHFAQCLGAVRFKK